MCLRVSVFCLLLAAAGALLAIEQGDLVVARQDVSLTVEGQKADQIGPGQVLRVLRIDGGRLWVSRGRPGWVQKADVIELDQAEAFFNEPFAKKPGARDYLARGTIRIALGKRQQALADIEKAIELASEPDDFLESLAYAQLAANLQPAAIETFNKALQDDPDSAAALMGRGLAYYQVGQNRNAIADLSKAIEQNPDHGFPRKYLGALYHDLGKLELAKEHLDAAVKIDAYDVFARKARGRLFFDQGDYEASLREFGIAVKIDASDIEALAGRGVVRHAIGTNLKAAAEDFANAIELAEETVENAYLWNNLGQAQMELGQLDQALIHLNKAIELDPDFSEPRSHRAYLLVTNGQNDAEKVEQAKADVKAVFVSRESKTYWDYRALAAINALLGDYQRAAKYQSLGETVLRQTGPSRFVKSATAERESYERADRR